MSLFRYPGGKTKQAATIAAFSGPVGTIVEPFVGGGSIFLHFLKTGMAQKAIINDKDPNISAFWKTMFGSSEHEFDKLVALVRQPVTLEHFNLLRKTPPLTLVDKAYYGLFFNRTTFSGISTAGPIGGQGQKSKWAVNCRYPTATLVREMTSIRNAYKGKVTVSSQDFGPFMALHRSDKNSLMYIDPPYYKKGSSLYPCQMPPADHIRLRDAVDNINVPFIVSYDTAPEVKKLYGAYTIKEISPLYTINGVKTFNKQGKEYVITP